MALGLGDFSIIAGMLTTVIGVPGWMLIRRVGELKEDNESLRGEVRKELSKLTERMDEIDENKVDRRDWLRSEASAANRIDRVCSKIDELSGRLEGGLLMSSKVERLAEAIEQRWQAANQ